MTLVFLAADYRHIYMAGGQGMATSPAGICACMFCLRASFAVVCGVFRAHRRRSHGQRRCTLGFLNNVKQLFTMSMDELVFQLLSTCLATMTNGNSELLRLVNRDPLSSNMSRCQSSMFMRYR